MADRWGQIENDISGGADVWDDGLAGEILLADYFAEPPITATGSLAATETGADTASASGTVSWQPITGALDASETGADVCDITDRIQKTYPLAGMEQAYPLTSAPVYPISAAQTYPSPAAPSYPLAGREQAYPLRRAA